jgi:hypothetical protein
LPGYEMIDYLSLVIEILVFLIFIIIINIEVENFNLMDVMMEVTEGLYSATDFELETLKRFLIIVVWRPITL